VAAVAKTAGSPGLRRNAIGLRVVTEVGLVHPDELEATER
jgi:hypothetical protein